MFKKKLFLSLIITVIFSCQKEQNINYAIIKGNISGINVDSIKLYNYYWDIIKTIPLKKDKSFIDTIVVTEQYYFFTIGNINKTLYLKPTHNLNIHINVNEKKTNITYSGFGAYENQYLLEKGNLIKKLPEISPSSPNYTSFKEEEFVNILESNYNKQINFLNKYLNLEKDFFYLESKSIEYEKLGRLSYYEGNIRYLTNNDQFKVSSNFPDFYKNIDLSNEKLKSENNYLTFINTYIRKLALKKSKNNDLFDKKIAMLDIISLKIKNQKLKDRLCYDISRHLETSNNIDLAFRKFDLIVKNVEYKKIIRKKYLKAKKIGKGDIAPTFNLEDNHNNIINLSDLKGSLVFIDIWNTYCKPCVIEIPKFEKLKKIFSKKKIKFVSICVNSSKENWKKMITKKNLTGIQLFSEKPNGEFFKKFMFNSAPRYILIDKGGKIIESHARKPSDPKLIEKIEKILK